MVSPIHERDGGVDTTTNNQSGLNTLLGKNIVVSAADNLALVPVDTRRQALSNTGNNPRDLETKNNSNSLEIENQFDNVPKVRIEPLKDVSFGFDSKIDSDFNKAMEREFDYLSRTGDLEINTERCNILQGIVDRMVDDVPMWKGRIKVVIINSGLDPNAFAYPEGSVFISQSLINILDNLDEVASVLGHEVKHLINKTSLNAAKSNFKNTSSIGVKWFHEMLSDFGSAELLNKAGFNTTATSTALSKLGKYTNNNRGGITHQAPTMRVIQQYMEHSVIEFENSSKPFTTMPPELRQRNKPNNLEKLGSLLKEGNLTNIEGNLRKLHKKDLWSIWKIYFGDLGKEDKKVVVKAFSAVITERLTAYGFDRRECKLFHLAMGLLPSEDLFNGLEEITAHVSEANLRYILNSIEKASKYLFENVMYNDPLNDILLLVSKEYINSDSINYLKNKSLFQEQIIKFILEVNKVLLPRSDKDSSKDNDRKDKIKEDLNNLALGALNKLLRNNRDSESKIEICIEFFSKLNSKFFSLIYPRQKKDFFFQRFLPIDLSIIDESHLAVYGVRLFFSDNEYGANKNSELPSTETISRNLESGERGKDEVKSMLRTIYLDNHLERPENSKEREEFTMLVKFTIDKILKPVIPNEKVWIDMLLGKILNKVEKDNYELEDNIEGKVNQPQTPSEVLALKGVNEDDHRNEVNQKLKIEKMKEVFEFISSFNFNSDGIVSDLDLAYELSIYVMNPEYNLIDVNNIQTSDLYNILVPLFDIVDEDKRVTIGKGFRKFDELYNLPFIQELVKRYSNLTFSNTNDLYSFLTSLPVSQNASDKKYFLWGDGFGSTILFGSLRKELVRLTKDISFKAENFNTLVKILDEFFPNTIEASARLKQLCIEYLESKDISIEDKIKFFEGKYKILGVEGATVLGEQLTTLDHFNLFRKVAAKEFNKYLSGEEDLSKVALGDFASSMLSYRLKKILDTVSIDDKSKAEISTEYAEMWLQVAAPTGEKDYSMAYYDLNKRKIIVNRNFKYTFKTFVDIVDSLKALSLGKRVSLAIKLLSDKDGFLTGNGNKTLLTIMIQSALKIKVKLIDEVIKAAIMNPDSDVVGFPAAKLLAPMLFQGLDSNLVNTKSIGLTTREQSGFEKARSIPRFANLFTQDLEHILSSTTRDIVIYGYIYSDDFDSIPAKELQQSAIEYQTVLSNISASTSSNKTKVETKTRESSKLDSSFEAIIGALETAAIFVKALQISVQVKSFPEEVKDRLSKTQDSMRGQTKLSFWENLVKRAEYEPEVAKLINGELVSLDEYKGGGSLFTTYAATLRDKDNKERKVVIKMLNPNAESFIRKTFEFSKSSIKEVIDSSSDVVNYQARIIDSLLDLSHEWCLKEIDDSAFEKDDEAYRSVIGAFNASQKAELVAAPGRVYTSERIKIEDLCKGNTLNNILNDKDVPKETKERLLGILTQFFQFQFEYSPRRNVNGEKEYLFHSDPHTGNYISDTSLDKPFINVIDRNMYIVLNEDEKNIFKLFNQGHYISFARKLISRCIDQSDLKQSSKNRLKNTVLIKLFVENQKQRSNKENDPFKYLEIISNSFLNNPEYSLVVKLSEMEETDKHLLSEQEAFILNYFEKSPSLNINNAYSKLSKDKEFHELIPSKTAYGKILVEMFDKNLLKRKVAEIPLKYRLMIRNVILMRNLGQNR